MIRKLACALTAIAFVAVLLGCKDDKPTPMNFDPKGMYTTQKDYSKGAPTGGAKESKE